jgi:hypothetical protein
MMTAEEPKGVTPGDSGGEILLYQTREGSTEIQVTLMDETVWLTQAQMADLFQRDVSVISRHIRNVFKEGELEEESNLHFLQTAKSDRPVACHSLDVIISVGYRVKSHRGTQFRIWATRRLREHILRPALARLGGEVTPAEQALATIEVLHMMARQQVELERQVAHGHTRMDKAALLVGEHDRRIHSLEMRVYGSGQVVSEAQAAELAAMVKGIAHKLTEQNPTGGNYYQSVWSELYRRYSVTTYRRVPAVKFGEVIEWLESWLESLHQDAAAAE